MRQLNLVPFGTAPVISEGKVFDQTANKTYDLTKGEKITLINGNTIFFSMKITDVDGDVGSSTELFDDWTVTDDGETGTTKYYVYDDGSTGSGDATAGDGIYTGKLTITDNETYNEQDFYYVKDKAGNKSNVIGSTVAYNPK